MVRTHGLSKILSDKENFAYDMFCWDDKIQTGSLKVYCHNEKLYHKWRILIDDYVTNETISKYCGQSCDLKNLTETLQANFFSEDELSKISVSDTREKYISGQKLEIRCKKGMLIEETYHEGAIRETIETTCVDGKWRFQDIKIETESVQKGKEKGFHCISEEISRECAINDPIHTEKYSFGDRETIFQGQNVKVTCKTDPDVVLTAICLKNGLIEIEPNQDSFDSCLKTSCTAKNLREILYDNNKLALIDLKCFKDGIANGKRCRTKCQEGFEWANNQMALGTYVVCKNKIWGFEKKVAGQDALAEDGFCVEKRKTCNAATYNEEGYTIPFNLELKDYQLMCLEGEMLNSYGRCVL